MKFIPKSIATFAIMLCLGFIVSAQESWIGKYSFLETGGKDKNEIPYFASHKIEIKKGKYGFVAELNTHGFQAFGNLICKAEGDDNLIFVYFENHGESKFNDYKKGELLFTMERKIIDDEPVIITNWHGYEPVKSENKESGNIYFKKSAINNYGL